MKTIKVTSDTIAKLNKVKGYLMYNKKITVTYDDVLIFLLKRYEKKLNRGLKNGST